MVAISRCSEAACPDVSAWQYTYITGTTNEPSEVLAELNDLGVLGWEAVGVTCWTGSQSVTILLKRQQLGLAHPTDRSPGWKYDPTRRHHLRYWDGPRWEQFVSEGDTAATTNDLPR